jgi:hypothetical protein
MLITKHQWNFRRKYGQDAPEFPAKRRATKRRRPRNGKRHRSRAAINNREAASVETQR